MKNPKEYAQNYVNWVLKLGRVKALLLGLVVLAALAISTQVFLSLLFTGGVNTRDIVRSMTFGLVSAPFVLYFFNLIVEKLEHSRIHLEKSLKKLSLLREQDARLNVQLEQKAEFLRSFIDASPDLVFYRDDQGKFLGCNRAMELLTGKTEKELINLTPNDVYSEETAKLIISTDRDTLISNTGVTYEQWIRYSNNKLSCFEIRKVPYYDRVQDRHCIMGFGRDVTERKRYQEVIEKNSRDKTVLMATISHELRTPLNGIIGLSQILLEGELSDQQREYLKTINISAVSLGHIFSDIIDLEKIDSRRIELFPKEIEFSQLISNISNFANLMAEQKKIHFHIQCSYDLPPFICVDNARLSQILWNLVSNAVKFTPSGGHICLNVVRNDQNHFSFILKDTGIGIHKKDQRKIFAMFYQAENEQGEKAIGSGIGLAISKRIAKLMGGDLTVESKLNEGSTFTLTVKADEVVPRQTVEISNHALKVLLVEDIQVNVVVAKAMLTKFGCEVDVAMTGAEAFELFKQNSYDLILLDIQLPDMTGFDIAKTWRDQYEEGEIDYLPLLVALTANIIHTREEYKQRGMDDVLRKPLSLEALADCLSHHFDDNFLEHTLNEKTVDPFDVANSNVVEKIVFDHSLLRELIEVMGKNSVLANFELFAKLMPEYLDNLSSLFTKWSENKDAEIRKSVLDEAHKIKGALASVGLIKLQDVAQQAQTDSQEFWDENIEKWVTQLQNEWQQDLQQAKEWVNQLN
ncbi:ATP-binding protein [Otariodibacter oris]|uniref:Aerobic respiration control sensor protein n=1 Tax=Otariodibacter oris TaxID=1032623 RepID=A0A420XHH8_9PAST|nr:ATP-binding protein [Otariodibacter oris]QGM81080.1 hybrid sensor histidine kinase/response regulator [Otariodibacter oris]RKR76733.1 two-component system aerobic respiration control sensor histidine kinase ArcB [Otariodibacter oris]